ncbi:histidinol-phosphate transaminase [Candidatus Leptofilum sp.]|uniref:histidinol-phosphate transaminase n=1 Tax=Candidatus Leptofilum sp. TaxID=3241576 RepID=UPI003B596BE7
MTNKFVRPDIAEMEPYVPIVPFEVLSARLGRAPEEIVKLDANENPYGPSPKALAALRDGRFFHIYPDPESNQLRDALSQFVQMPKERLLTGMGADELIDLVLRVVLSPNDVVIDCPPSFGMYPFSTAVNSGQYVQVWRKEDFRLDIPAIEEAVANHPTAKILFLCSPNNPDGSTITDTDLRRLLQLPLLVVLDEAYVDFDFGHREKREETTESSVISAANSSSRIHWTLEYDNLAVLRTFSKLAGLAGLRVGYGAFPEWLLPHLWKIKQPYNINVAASLAALASLEDQQWLQEKVQLLVTEREHLFTELGTISYLNPFPSRSNFILCRVVGRDAQQLKLDLEQAGILVRYFKKPGVDNCIRISAGRPEETDRLIAELRRLGD